MPTVEAKGCSSCKTVRPARDFAPGKRMRSGLQSQCRPCSREWHKARPDYVRRKNKDWRQANPTYGRDWQRQANYGLSPDDVAALRAAQNGACAGCLTDLTTTKECVDHCHSSSAVRGLLCNRCNLALGYAADDAARLRRLADYLDHHKSLSEAYK